MLFHARVLTGRVEISSALSQTGRASKIAEMNIMEPQGEV